MLLLSQVRNINLLVAGYFFRPISSFTSPNVARHRLRSFTSRSMSSPSTLSSSVEARWNSIIDITGALIAQDAYNLDQDLFATGFTLEQLMELAGLSVAEAVCKCIPLQPLISESNTSVDLRPRRILVVCGPVRHDIFHPLKRFDIFAD